MRFLRSLVVLTMLLAPALVAGPAASPAAASPLPADLSQRLLPFAGARDCVSSGRVYVLAVNENGGVVASGCTSSFSNGKAALTSVASVTERDRDPGFVCQINSSPSVCYEGKDFNGPAQSKYWQYWQGTPGGSWSYSNWGYIPYHPQPGSVEGWCYGRTGEKCPGLLNDIINIQALSTQPEPRPTRTPTRKPAPEPTEQATRQATRKAQPPVAATTRPVAPRASTPARRQPATPARSSSSTPTTQSTAPRSSQQETSAAPSSSRPSASPSQTASQQASATGSDSPMAGESGSHPVQSSGNPTSVETVPVASPPGGANGTPWAAIATGGLIASVAAAFGVSRLRGRSEE